MHGFFWVVKRGVCYLDFYGRNRFSQTEAFRFESREPAQMIVGLRPKELRIVRVRRRWALRRRRGAPMARYFWVVKRDACYLDFYESRDNARMVANLDTRLRVVRVRRSAPNKRKELESK